MTPVLSPGSVPAARAVVKTAYCVECFSEFRPSALRGFYGRELCPACYAQEEAACFGAQESEYEALDWGRAAATSDRLERVGDVLRGMGF